MTSENKSISVPEKKPVYKKAWFWVVIVILVIIGLSNLGSGNSSNQDSSSNNESTSTPAPEENVVKSRVVSGELVTLGAGSFVVGSDLKAGYYDITAGAGESGNLTSSGGLNEILGGEYGVSKVRASLMDNEEVKLSGLSQVIFTPVTAAFIGEHKDTQLYSGKFIVGEDIGEGRYKVSAVSGSGNLFTSGGVNEILGGEYGVPEVTLNLKNGQEVKISGIESVNFAAL